MTHLKRKRKPLQKPLVGHRKLVKQGGSYYISVHPDWLEAHGIDPEKVKELLTIANADIRIVNPDREAEVYAEVSKLVERGEYEAENNRHKGGVREVG